MTLKVMKWLKDSVTKHDTSFEDTLAGKALMVLGSIFFGMASGILITLKALKEAITVTEMRDTAINLLIIYLLMLCFIGYINGRSKRTKEKAKEEKHE